MGLFDIDSIGAMRTPSQITQVRPKALDVAQGVYEKIAIKYGGNTDADAVNLMGALSEIIRKTKGHSLSSFWGELESKLYGGKTLATPGLTTDEDKFNVGIGLFYYALDAVDRKSLVETSTLESYFDIYTQASTHVDRYVTAHQEGATKRKTERMFTILDLRYNEVAKRFNTEIDDQVRGGQKLSLIEF